MNNTYIVIDFDSTLVEGEALELLASFVLDKRDDKEKILSEILEITKQGMEGKITFDQSLEKRLSLFCPQKKDIKKLVTHLKKTISKSALLNKDFFTKNANKIYVVSGGFKEFILPITRKFDLFDDHVFANTFIYEGNTVIGFDKHNLLSQKGGKVATVKKLNLTGKIIAIGDGYTDYELKKESVVDTFVAFTEHVARDSVVRNADFVARCFCEVVRLSL